MHLLFDHFDAVDVAFDIAGAVGPGEVGEDGVVVVAQAASEGVQVGRPESEQVRPVSVSLLNPSMTG
ncbi:MULTISPECIES: hypothetical protein [unclassified Pseudofrankia]|uniref:hypothetical protein n=1 Tax=unclassified Pseudofrankia TaxID=2994372 RepID=UPI001042572C|nr:MULTISPECIES: hypothetical protein [unclassified Pseudofrankia]MDT3446193.1 hypothetical protein [Pseudofrankia sp. BMG5.37]